MVEILEAMLEKLGNAVPTLMGWWCIYRVESSVMALLQQVKITKSLVLVCGLGWNLGC